MNKKKGRSQTKTRSKIKTKAKSKIRARNTGTRAGARRRAARPRAAKRPISAPPRKLATRARAKAASKRVVGLPAAPVTKSLTIAPIRAIETTIARIATRKTPAAREKLRRVHPARVARPVAAGYGPHRRLPRPARVQQFNYMKAPGLDAGFDVGDTVEVFCDHERNSERTRGWIKGVVVQVDNKLVAVQFRSNVFLTDGWMVPDRILWYALTSEQIRSATLNKKGSRTAIPDY
jgi:hypothetical protein